MTSYCVVTNSVYPVTMIIMRHGAIIRHDTPLVEFDRGEYNQAIVPGITSSAHHCSHVGEL